jgi:hypothetical protein
VPSRPLADETLAVVGSSHPLAKKRRVEFEALLGAKRFLKLLHK